MAKTTIAERFYPAAVDATYTTLGHVLHHDGRFQLRAGDAESRSYSFSSGVSAFTWGENFTARVTAQDEGAVVRVEGTPKWTTVASRRRIRKLTERLFGGVSHYLQATETGG